MKKEYIITTSSLNKVIIILILVIIIIILMLFLLFEDTNIEIATFKNVKSSYITENPKNLKKHIGIDNAKKKILNHSAKVSSGHVLDVKDSSNRIIKGINTNNIKYLT
ncbi:hypothetical protein [Candidatus Phytoplasma bonamiae]|uniref:Effector n=1 Tax=Candidatus Phytoplasma bonamiae TaxID=2982626 RepID=A0ABT9D9C2_9MOLU|nr:hypothetical protein ['Bonamia sp.' little leaf phytoplasma]MDO8064335.1 hypothetical protein ['Bonamia sp.' little leaf phytoplasma]MDV3174813.1 hypothetical protein ['Bonamia sp.' little leaf phytoplasma]